MSFLKIVQRQINQYMSTIKCLVCETEHDEGTACPNCSFESHYALSGEMSEKLKPIEEERKNNHHKWWEAQQQKISNLNNTIAEKDQVIAAKKEECESLTSALELKKQECKSKKEECVSLTNALNAKKEECNSLSVALEDKRKECDILNKALEDERKKCGHCHRPQQSESQRICYLVHKENDSLRDIHPIYTGETMVGRNPDQGEKRCRITTGCKELQNNHFKIVEQGNGTITAVAIERIAVETPSDVVNPGDECTLDNSTTIYIGNVQLIVLLQ